MTVVICPICNQPVTPPAHLQAHLLAGQAAICRRSGSVEIYKVVPAIINAAAKETSPTVSPSLAWLLTMCDQTQMEAWLKL